MNLTNDDIVYLMKIDLEDFKGHTKQECANMLTDRATKLGVMAKMNSNSTLDFLIERFVDKCSEVDFRFKNDDRAWFNDGE